MAKHVPASACVEDQETRMLRDSIRGFMARELTEERISQCEATGDLPWAIMGELRQFGYLGGLLSEEAGGYGLSYRTWAMMMEEAGYRWLSLRVLLNTVNIVIALFHHLGDARQKEKWLKPVMAGQMPVWVGITEPDHGSDVASVQTRAEDKGDHYIVNGQKTWTSGGQWADKCFAIVRTDKSDKHKGISFMLIDMDTPGVEVRPITMISGTSPFCETFFTDVKVPKENLVGEEGQGWTIGKRLLQHERTNLSGGGSMARMMGASLSNIAKKYCETNEDGSLADPILRDKIANFEIRWSSFLLTARRAVYPVPAGHVRAALRRRRARSLAALALRRAYPP